MLSDNVNAIMVYVIEHFDAEEHLMYSEEYPLCEAHSMKHDIFRNKMDGFFAELDADEIDIDDYVKRLCALLVNWFKDELLKDDIELDVLGVSLSATRTL